MSYVVSIRRLDGSPITVDDLRLATREDQSFREAAISNGEALHPSVLDLEWLPEGSQSPVSFSLSAGEVTVTTPSNAALRKLQELAGRLGASVIGEEGEDLTSVPVPAQEASGCGPAEFVIVFLLAALGLWWLLAG